jgi:hypothetical protein
MVDPNQGLSPLKFCGKEKKKGKEDQGARARQNQKAGLVLVG